MEIKKERTIKASPTVVWNVLTEPRHIKRWLGVETESNWKVDSELLFKFSWDGKEYVDKGNIIHLEENKLFVYTFWSNFSRLPDKPENYSKIRFDLEEKGIITVLKLTHSEIKNRTMREHSEKNWEETLDQIKSIAESIKNN
ncbi:SRPBCC domain-containing protein [Zhouia spongiae]|uniref:SRPBCC domain-containing protein n=1 Tax=Zhouia spongiae TaxID=2202721 RepID=A0ABY3YME3_9FLAO|nr:SRPBCC domain-containing protein [Zhouia spongiae]UNY98769.1 SRPBCC domain-containing protein [Zhouia spongiae]